MVNSLSLSHSLCFSVPILYGDWKWPLSLFLSLFIVWGQRLRLYPHLCVPSCIFPFHSPDFVFIFHFRPFSSHFSPIFSFSLYLLCLWTLVIKVMVAINLPEIILVSNSAFLTGPQSSNYYVMYGRRFLTSYFKFVFLAFLFFILLLLTTYNKRNSKSVFCNYCETSLNLGVFTPSSFR